MKEISKISYYTTQPKMKKNIYLKKHKTNIIKPPFRKGIYSYKQCYTNDSQKLIANNLFIYETPNYSVINIKKEGNNIFPFDNNNSFLSYSSINLNKYKIYNIPNKIEETKFDNNNNSNNKNNSNYIKNTNLSVSMNTINKNNENNINNKIYKDYFSDSRLYEKESRRMMIELIKILKKNMINNNHNINQIILDNNFSLKILNQDFNEKEYENENENITITNYNTSKEVFGEAKKQVYLKNLDYYISQNSTVTTEILTNNNNNFFNVENNNYISYKKTKTNILNYLLTPRVMNMILSVDEKQKFIFLITLDEIFYLEGKESYIFRWKNMDNEIENEFNINDIILCQENKIYKNRFYIKLKDEEFNENNKDKFHIYEIETPNNEICHYYVLGINYLLYKYK